MSSPALRRAAVPATVLALAATVAACGATRSQPSSSTNPTTAAPSSSSSSSSHRTSAATTSTHAVNPNQRETLPPGDIPDQIAYVPFTDRRLAIRISIPEGWSRTMRGADLSFTSNLNRVDVFAGAARVAPTVSSVRSRELPVLGRRVGGFRLQSVTAVDRPAGPAIRSAYLGDSAPNRVTGKVGTLAFERYDFFHRGREYVVLVSSPKGSDNVDPWRIITRSVRFTS